jgi:hypothetical protein
MKTFKLSPATKGKIDVAKELSRKHLGRYHISAFSSELTTSITLKVGKHEIEVYRSMDRLTDEQISMMFESIRAYMVEPVSKGV